MRVVSLIASATEIICALGMEEHLVGRSHECDFPPSVQRLPVCTEPKFDIHGTSREIDERVKSVLSEATSVYRVHADVLRELQPDVIVTQTQCEVCAVSAKDVEQAVCDWLGSRPTVVSLQPNALGDVWQDVRRVAEALGVPERGEELLARLQGRVHEVAKKSATLKHHPSVACLEWLDPLMAAGNWMPELVELAGGVNVFGTAGAHSPILRWEDLRAKDPEVILALPCGWGIAQTRAEMGNLTRRADWPALRAVRCGHVFVADGNQFFNRPGPRLVESLEILAEVLHPEVFAFRHEGLGWERFQQ